MQHIQIQDVYIEETPCKKIKAYVQGSSWRCYNTEVVVDEEVKELHSYRCECPAHVEYAGLCKHCVATLLRYFQVREDIRCKQEAPAKKLKVEFPEKIAQLEATPGIALLVQMQFTQEKGFQIVLLHLREISPFEFLIGICLDDLKIRSHIRSMT